MSQPTESNGKKPRMWLACCQVGETIIGGGRPFTDKELPDVLASYANNAVVLTAKTKVEITLIPSYD